MRENSVYLSGPDLPLFSIFFFFGSMFLCKFYDLIFLYNLVIFHCIYVPYYFLSIHLLVDV